MLSTINSYVGFNHLSSKEKPALKLSAEQPRALPSSWYRSPDMYQLERRAIFSKKWLLVTHKLRFKNPGDYLRFEEAGYPFVLCLDRGGTLHGFHNICRHRAFPVVTEDEGNAKIFSCKYHGWSYALNGKLTKAPRFDEVKGFQKEDHGLFAVHVHVDKLGFVWVNLEASETPSVAWEDDFAGVDNQERFKNFDFSKYKFDHVWGMKGEYNWKTLADNYNECYHCTVAHPDVARIADLSHYYTVSKAAHIQHFYRPQKGKEEDDVKNASTYYFPNACMTISPHFFYMMRCVPTSATTSSMEYEVYRHVDATDEDFNYVDQFFKRVLDEDKHLCNAAQKNLNAGVFVNGQMHPELESAPLFFQNAVKEVLVNHRSEETRQGRDIWPARRTLSGKTTEDQDAFCSGLAGSGSTVAELEW